MDRDLWYWAKFWAIYKAVCTTFFVQPLADAGWIGAIVGTTLIKLGKSNESVSLVFMGLVTGMLIEAALGGICGAVFAVILKKIKVKTSPASVGGIFWFIVGAVGGVASGIIGSPTLEIGGAISSGILMGVTGAILGAVFGAIGGAIGNAMWK